MVSLPGYQRVAQLIESDGPGGAESVVLELCSELRRRGREVFPVVFGEGEGWLSGRMKQRGFDVFLPVLRSGIPLDLGFLFSLCRWIRRSEIQVLHSHDFTMSIYAGLAGAITGVPHVITLHGGKYFATARKRRVALRWIAARSRATVGVSQATCDHIAEALTLPESMIQLVFNGVSPLTGDREATRKSLGVAEGESLILAVGNLYKVKGHRVLISAAATLASMKDLPPWRIVVAGRGEEESALTGQIREQDLQHRVTLLGLRDDVGDLLAAADCWVMPSLSEGLPMALLEAMFATLPVVCSGVGGIPSMLGGGDAGMLVPPNRPTELAVAIRALLLDPAKAQALGRRGQEIVLARYSVSKMADEYELLYRQTPDESRTRAVVISNGKRNTR